MGYSDFHTDDDCDKCLKTVGRHNLKPLPFLFLDMNDHVHPVVKQPGYRQYYCCKKCYNAEVQQ